jgi:hypothetical protein
MKVFSVLLGTLAAVLLIAVLLLVFGVRFSSDAMVYDPAREIVATGTVQGHDEFACPASNGELGDHILLKANNKLYEVHLAPARIMRSTQWKFNNGQTIEVRGAEVRYRGQDGLIARQITSGDNVYTFRDASGQLLLKQ